VSKPKCCGTCKHWGKPGQKCRVRRCVDCLDSSLFTPSDVGTECEGWKPKRPPRKPAPFRRWSKGTFLHGNVLFDGEQVSADELIAALNRARVVLPKGKP